MKRLILGKVTVLVRLSRLLTALVILSLPSQAHEVQPAVADLTIEADRVDIVLRMTLEAPLAGVNLAGLVDTNDADNASAYDAARALEPDALRARLEQSWPGLASRMTLRAGNTDLEPELRSASIPEVGNVEAPRFSTVILSAALPPDDGAIVFGWDPSLGNLIVRQQGVEDGYTAYLDNGKLSAPIPREGSTDETALQAFANYTFVGFDHIIPKGLDHILFVLGLFFITLRLGPLLWQISAFTVAHTVTLALGALDIIRIPAEVVEPIIAASIVYVGVENVLSREMKPWRPALVFAFGLLHGLGFASVLSDFGLGASHFVPKLVGFNVGVEIGQLAVIAAAFIVLGVFARADWYKIRVATPISVAISLIALFWVFERTGVIETDAVFGIFAALTEGGMTMLWGGVAIGAMVVLTGIALLVDDPLLDAGCGFLTSFAAFLAILGAFTAESYWLMLAITGLWFTTLRLQSLDEAGEV